MLGPGSGPLGRLQLAAHTGVTGAFDRYEHAVGAVRERVLLAAVIAAALAVTPTPTGVLVRYAPLPPAGLLAPVNWRKEGGALGGRGVPLAALLALACGIGVACFAMGTEAAAPVGDPVTPVVTAAGPQPLPPSSRVQPVGLRIPAIDVSESTLVPLGLTPTGQLEVPADFARAGWFADGVVLGAPGPAVIAGHVDSRDGPAVFFRLRELRPGDTVDVTLADGTVAGFVVDDVQHHRKDAFPTAAVYGPVPASAMRLITCGGRFDAGARSYRDNVVVFASPH